MCLILKVAGGNVVLVYYVVTEKLGTNKTELLWCATAHRQR